MTLAEYLTDYAGEGTKHCGEDLIEKELLTIPNEKRREIARDHISNIYESNKRDFYF